MSKQRPSDSTPLALTIHRLVALALIVAGIWALATPAPVDAPAGEFAHPPIPTIPAPPVTERPAIAAVAVPVTTTTSTTVPVTTTTTIAPPETTVPSTTLPPAQPVSSGGVWDRLAACESGGNWSINTGNGYYGGLQFSAQTWQAMGGTGLPHEHPRSTQIAVAERLLAVSGWGAWPACSRQLGLR